MDSWSDLQSAFVEYVGDAGDLAKLARWRADFDDAIPAAAFAIEALEQELQIPRATKGAILGETIALYAPTAPAGAAPVSECPLAALENACLRYPNCGVDIEVSSTLVHFEPYEGTRLIARNGRAGTFAGLAGGPVTEVWREAADVLVGTITSRAVNLFSTFETYVEELDDPRGDFAASVRDHLGVPHLNEIPLLEIRLSAALAMKSGTAKKPTFADARGYPPFMASREADKAHGWARLLSGDGGARGAPEVWHGDIAARAARFVRRVAPSRLPLREPWGSLNKYLQVRKA